MTEEIKTAVADSADSSGKLVFKIVADKKRTVKSTCSGQVVEVLKRAKGPLTVGQVAQRVKGTKAGKDVKVNDIKARVEKVLKWYVDHTDYVTDEDGAYALTTVEA